jgi:hypothetical protein
MKKKKRGSVEICFSFELGFKINNLVELGFLKIFYVICLTKKKKKKNKRGSVEIFFF